MLKGEFLRRGDRFLTYTTKPKTFLHFNKYQNEKKLQWKVCSTAALVQYLLFLCGLLAAGFIFLYTHIYTYIYIYIHTYRHTYMHTYIHTHIRTFGNLWGLCLHTALAGTPPSTGSIKIKTTMFDSLFALLFIHLIRIEEISIFLVGTSLWGPVHYSTLPTCGYYF